MKKIIATANAPAAVGPYSQGVRVGDLIFTAGQIGLDPATMKLAGDDIALQAEQALRNLQAILQAAGSDLEHVAKTTVYLRYIKDYGPFNEIYSRFFGASKPARSAFAVAALPLGALVEIEAVALIPGAPAEEDAESGSFTLPAPESPAPSPAAIKARLQEKPAASKADKKKGKKKGKKKKKLEKDA